MTQLYRCAAIVPVLLALGGYGAVAGFGNSAPPETYDLLASKLAPLAKSRRTDLQLEVSEPSAVRALATDRILVKPRSESISYYPNARWSDRLPALLQTRLIESLSRSQRFAAVGGGNDRIEADIRFATDIRAFQIEVNGAGAEARIALFVKMFHEKNGRIIASQNFEAAVPAPKDSAQGAVQTMNGSLQNLLGKIIAWTANVRIGESVRPPAGRPLPGGDAVSSAPARRG